MDEAAGLLVPNVMVEGGIRPSRERDQSLRRRSHGSNFRTSLMARVYGLPTRL